METDSAINKQELLAITAKIKKKTTWNQISGRKGRLVLIFIGALLIFFVEFSVGMGVNSLSLIADSFHEINDASAIIIALVIHTV